MGVCSGRRILTKFSAFFHCVYSDDVCHGVLYLEGVAGHEQQPPDVRGRPAAEEHDHDHEQHPASGMVCLEGDEY